jgi:hypothetical protein
MIAVSGSTVVTTSGPGDDNRYTLYVFSKPKSGWSGDEVPHAERTMPGGYDSLGPDVAISGTTLIGIALDPVEHECPCDGFIFDANEPSSGWHGRAAMTPSFGLSDNSAPVVTSGPQQIAISGSSLAVGADDGVHVLAILAPATISHVALRGVRAGNPRLSMRLLAGGNAPPTKSVTLTLPRDLEFTTRQRRLARGINVAGANHDSAHLQNGRLVLQLRTPGRRLVLSIGAPSLLENSALTKRLAAIIKFDEKHRRKRSLDLPFTLAITDSARHATRLTVQFGLS